MIGVVIHETFRLLAFLDPLAYAQISSDSASSGSQAAASAGPGMARYSSIPLLIAYVALAVLQWRRVEA